VTRIRQADATCDATDGAENPCGIAPI